MVLKEINYGYGKIINLRVEVSILQVLILVLMVMVIEGSSPKVHVF